MTFSRYTLISCTSLALVSGVLLLSNTHAQITTPATTAAPADAAQHGPPGSGVYYTEHIKAATAVTEVFGEGQKITAAIVEYDAPIKNSSLSQAAFTVTGYTVTRVYANTTAAKAMSGRDGRFVVLELSTAAAAASTSATSTVAPPTTAASATTGSSSSVSTAGGSTPSGGPPAMGPMTGGSQTSVTLNQIQPVSTVAGASYAPTVKTVASTRLSNLIADDFKQFRYTDPVTGLRLDYNLYIPKNLGPNQAYPLVLFMPDASTIGTNVYNPLTQGLGAVAWASPADQAKHPAFVLAPEYPVELANDDSQTSQYMDVTIRLIEQLSKQYHVDTKRLYTTGQSGGCMTSIAMNIKYPNFFAASFLVAGQWDATQVAPMAKNKLFIVVSQDDAKAYPGMNAITTTLEQNGGKVSRAVWDGTTSAEALSTNASTLVAQNPQSNVYYASFAKGTVIPAGQSTQGAAGHSNTWRVAYTISSIRDWVFQQHK
ncbi:peptidase [Deinococcus alpinitundrae]|uniref:peptidase n=1 Tax=Deinococcus alpinitundrae TaxID=468913 RepID=UPI00137AEA9E|nr:peptidase [Deinococcus alpinitundrae]